MPFARSCAPLSTNGLAVDAAVLELGTHRPCFLNARERAETHQIESTHVAEDRLVDALPSGAQFGREGALSFGRKRVCFLLRSRCSQLDEIWTGRGWRTRPLLGRARPWLRRHGGGLGSG